MFTSRVVVTKSSRTEFPTESTFRTVGLVRAVRREEETAKPTRRPQRVRSSREGESSQQRQGARRAEETGR
ncbi:hypothetical protein Taro_008027 [Colocasia esculenta]|uniref:Uncharacterized protein n=1 Tax=Colocasia esculenta TaxID=4460 RepID=A0A843TZZ8_COLES|nr:hypothetical protein [Colocasia esculenta]